MSWALAVPAGPEQHLLWAQTTLVWMAGTYLGTVEPVGREALAALKPESRRGWRRRTLLRAGTAALLCWSLPGFTLQGWQSRLLLATVVLLGLAALPVGRLVLVSTRRLDSLGLLAEWEVVANVVLITVTGLVIASGDLAVTKPLVEFPIPTGRLTAVLLVAASLIVTCRGGTHIVRGILDKVGAYPLDKPANKERREDGKESPQVDESEYNRGRTIGNLERLLMTTMVAAGSLEALGLIVGAKGLIRAKEFEDRDFAEYFIVGSLASVAVAISVGAFLHFVLPRLWMT